MQDISRGGGRTVLFVSHNMAAVKSLCTRAIVINKGTIMFEGDVEESINYYLNESTVHESIGEIKDRKGSGIVKIKEVDIYGNSKGILPQTGQPFHMEFILANPEQISSNQITFDLRIDDHIGQRIAWMSDSVLPNQVTLIGNKVLFSIPKLNLNNGLYYVTTHIRVNNEVSDWIQNAFSFEVIEGDYYGSGKKTPPNQSKTLLDYNVNYL
jgi:lipopolysaccharide transport system ATP-binding protein